MPEQTPLERAWLAMRKGNFADVAAHCQAALAAHPGDEQAQLLWGVALARQGRAPEAIQRMEPLAEASTPSVEALNWLSSLYRSTGQIERALSCSQRAADLAPTNPDVLNNFALCHYEAGDLEEAVRLFERASSLAPLNSDYLYSLGTTLGMLGRLEEAAQALRGALRLAPGMVGARLRLGEMLLTQGLPEHAEVQARHAAQHDSRNGRAHLLLGKALLAMGRWEDAEQSVQRALTLGPASAEAYAIQGVCLKSRGDFVGAVAAFDKSIAVQPEQGMAYCYRVTSARATEADLPLIERMRALAARSSLSPSEQMYLHYALGKCEDDMGAYASAFQQFLLANELVRRVHHGGKPFDRGQVAAQNDRVIETFTADFLERAAATGLEDETPVFVLGMIRSGTTLAEQILSSHPQVAAAGEQPFWVRHAQQALAGGNVTSLAKEYLALLGIYGKGALRVVDKNPNNYLVAGLLHIALPQARIVHLRRHPVDICISILATPNGTPGSYIGDLDDLVFVYEEYRRLMAHWRAVLPADRFLEVDYESLVLDREATTRKVVDFCGLEWDEACLHPEENLRSVTTPSFWQVRQPVYSNSIGRWKNYEPWLGPLQVLLDPEVG